MAQVSQNTHQITQQIKQQSEITAKQAQVEISEIKTPQSHDKVVEKPMILQQKLSVEVMPLNQHENPQQEQKKTQTVPQNTSRYGPFHELSPNAKALLNSENLNYDINIQPVLTNITQERSKNMGKDRKSVRQKKSQSILTEESIPQHSAKANPQELQKEILQLAKNIRQKVWKKDVVKINNDSIVTTTNNKKLQKKQTQPKLRQLYQKRQSLFEKYSYPHSTSVTLAEIQKQQQRLKLGKYNTSRVYNQQQQFQLPQSESQSPVPSNITLNMQSSHQQNPQPQHRSKSRTQESSSARKQSQLPRLKLSFDKTHHKYKMTEFRKSILRENKQRQLAKSLLIREKEETLQKRREIYNNSRYHPVGIKLSSLRLSKMVNHSNSEKGQNQLLRTSPKVNKDALEQQKQQMLQEDRKKTPQLNQQITQQNPYPTPPANPSQVKSSLTFNFSFSDPIQPQLKSQAQLYSQVQNLTKLLENDSTPQEKMDKLHKEQDNRNQQKEAKKQVSAEGMIDKGMAESKMIGDVERLHNSSDEEYGEKDKDVELEYSYV